MTNLPSPQDLVAAAIECDPATLGDDSGLGVHPKWDSLGHLAVMVALETHYGVSIDDDGIRRYATLAAIRERHAALLKEAGSPTPKAYWREMPATTGQAAPNASLFRLLGQAGFKCEGSAMLEIGFGHGADLLEAQRRGAKIYGLDINQPAVTRMRALTGLDHFAVADASSAPFPFRVRFDAIYSRDTIYYLSDDEIAAFAGHARAALAAGGLLALHFIEADFERLPNNKPPSAEVEECQWHRLDHSFAHDNPLRFLDPQAVAALVEGQGFSLIGRKTISETYGIEEALMRRQRYLLFR